MLWNIVIKVSLFKSLNCYFILLILYYLSKQFCKFLKYTTSAQVMLTILVYYVYHSVRQNIIVRHDKIKQNDRKILKLELFEDLILVTYYHFNSNQNCICGYLDNVRKCFCKIPSMFFFCSCFFFWFLFSYFSSNG